MWNVSQPKLTRAFAAVLAASAWAVTSADTPDNVVVTPDAVEPAVLHTKTGERVDFVNRTGRAVHLQFGGDPGGHRVVQVPTTGPFWVVFHRPGAHPYVVHVYGAKERSLSGVVEVSEGRQESESPTCGVTAMGVCIEP